MTKKHLIIIAVVVGAFLAYKMLFEKKKANGLNVTGPEASPATDLEDNFSGKSKRYVLT